MVFAALAGTPAAAFLCRPEALAVFGLFPLAGALHGGKGYLKRLAALALPPGVALGWALLWSPEAVFPSLRWLSAVAAGSYFAWVLGAAGCALVLRKLAGRVRLLEKPLEPVIFTLLAGGPAAAAARGAWIRGAGKPLIPDRLAEVAEEVLTGVAPAEETAPEVGFAPVLLAGAGWLFLTLATAGLL